MKKSFVSCAQRSTYFQILCCVLERWIRTLNQSEAWEDRLTWFKSSQDPRALDRIDGEPIEFEWNIFPGLTTLQLCNKVQEFLSKWANSQKNSQVESFSCRCSTTSHGDQKTTRKNANQVFSSFLYLQKDSEQDKGHSSERKWYSISEDSPQGEWDKMAEKMMVTLAESGHPVSRATSPLSRGVLKSKGGGKLSIHYCADQETITTVFRTIISLIQAQSLRRSRRNVRIM